MDKRTMIYKTLHRKQKNEPHEHPPFKIGGELRCSERGGQFLLH